MTSRVFCLEMKVDSNESLPTLVVKQESDIKKEYNHDLDQASAALDNAVSALRRKEIR